MRRKVEESKSMQRTETKVDNQKSLIRKVYSKKKVAETIMF